MKNYKATDNAIENLNNLPTLEGLEVKPIASIASTLAPAIRNLNTVLAKADLTNAEYGFVIASAIASAKGMTLEEVGLVEAGSKLALSLVKTVKKPLLDATFENWKPKCSEERRFRNAVNGNGLWQGIFKKAEKVEDDTAIDSEDWKAFKELFPKTKTLEDIKTAKLLLSKFSKCFESEDLFKAGLAK